jgi:O-antigen/teichoic acid export membrane protein
LAFLAEPALLLLYRDAEFLAAASLVRVLAAALLLQVVTSVLGHALWAQLQERATLRIVGINVAVNVLVGALMISLFGVFGAAIASVITWAVNAVQHYVAYARLHGRIQTLATTWKAVAASLAMAAAFAALSGAGIVGATAMALFAYVATAGGLLVATSGGVKKLCAGFFSPLTG